MKRMAIDTADRLACLKRRLGIHTKCWNVRIKRGGWFTIPPSMLRSLGLGIGDVIKWRLTPRGLEGVRERSLSGHTPKHTQPPRQLGQDESIVCDFRPSFRRRQSGQATDCRPRALPNSKPSGRTNQYDQASVYRGSSLRFRKQPRTVSIKRLALNFEKLLHEVMLGRVVRLTAGRGQGSAHGMALIPIALKDRLALRHEPKKKRYISSKSGKRW